MAAAGCLHRHRISRNLSCESVVDEIRRRRVHRADERRLSGAAVQQISRERSGVRIEALLADEELKIARHTAAMIPRAADF
jgi:hypothetical protein